MYDINTAGTLKTSLIMNEITTTKTITIELMNISFNLTNKVVIS